MLICGSSPIGVVVDKRSTMTTHPTGKMDGDSSGAFRTVCATIQRLDTEKSGFILADLLKEMLLQIGLHQDPVDTLLSTGRFNRNGMIQYEPFLQWLFDMPCGDLPTTLAAEAISGVGEQVASTNSTEAADIAVRRLGRIPSIPPC